MQLRNAIRNFLVCIIAEGFPRSVENHYYQTLNPFLNFVGDVEVNVLTQNHVNRYLEDIRTGDEYKHLKHTAVLLIFTQWLKAQNQIRPLASRQDPPRRLSRWWLITPRRLAARKKLPLVR